MSASLVGSEMCIRDSSSPRPLTWMNTHARASPGMRGARLGKASPLPAPWRLDVSPLLGWPADSARVTPLG
eukprot:1272225-Alexandrium_andersonii.AAC.1